VAKVSQILGEQLFPERRLLLQSSAGVRHVALPGWLQAMLLATSLATVGAVAYLGVGFMHLRESLDNHVADSAPVAPPAVQAAAAQPNPAPVAGANSVVASPGKDDAALGAMQGELASIKQQLTAVSQKYDQTNANYQQAASQLATLTQQNSQLQSQLADANARAKSALDAREDAERHLKADEQALNSRSNTSEQLTRNLDNARTELQQSEVERTTLQNRVQQLQMDLQSAQSRADQLDARNQQLQQQQVAADPQRVAPAVSSAPVASAPAMVPPVAPEAAQPPDRKPAPAVGGTPHAQNSSSGATSELEQLLASTGLDINRLLHSVDAPAEGGPYIALNDPRASALDHQRLDDLKRLAKNLPLAAPLKQYSIGSEFGARIDPINHRASFHPGLDFDAPYETTVYSTGAGIVIYTGTMDSYGRVVEIDHGHGIVTRYAHLHRILVAKGQRVNLHTPIAELGSTGRSTGPHLHYEVRVDGTAVDPAKFMQAGKNVVQVSGQQ
jgi:murein DD-endopeptidase MepM/ murein hydrolase activator NlpD